MKRSIAVTGRGILVSNAASVREFSEALRSGRSGIRPVTAIDSSPYACKVAGEVEEVGNDGQHPDGRVYQLLRRAVDQAIAEVGEAWIRHNAANIGIVVGTTCGAAGAKEWLLERDGPHRQEEAEESAREDKLLDQIAFESFPTPIAQRLGLGGPTFATSVACATGASSVQLACDLLYAEEAESMIAAACDALALVSFGGFSLVRAMARDTCRPFDRDRDGMLVGEGAAAFVLETTERARARGAPIYAEILGYGRCNDAFHSAMPDPKGEGLAASIREAMTMAGVGPHEIDLVCAHGTATSLNDSMERAAYRAVFGDRLREVPVTAIKSMTGHTLSAAGAVELLAAICALEGGFVPPTLGHRTPEEGCPLFLVREEALPRDLQVALCCGAAFGGNNSAVLVKRMGPASPAARRGEP